MIETLLLPLVPERFLIEPKYREGHLKVINALPGRRILGLHMPEMKAVAKELASRDDAAEIIRGFEKEALSEAVEGYGSRLVYEETVVWGLMINAMKITWEARAEFMRNYIPVLDNWAVCDTFCGSMKWVKDNPAGARKGMCSHAMLWEFMQPYWTSDKEFEVRFAIVASLVHFLDDEWFPKVFEKLDSLDFETVVSQYGDSPYYVRMAVAWLLATALAKMPEQTRAFVNASGLPENVRRLYARKARESFRTRDVSPF